MLHEYTATRAAAADFRWVRFDGKPADTTNVEIPAGHYVFRGSKRAFNAHLAALNQLHGTGYALPGIVRIEVAAPQFKPTADAMGTAFIGLRVAELVNWARH